MLFFRNIFHCSKYCFSISLKKTFKIHFGTHVATLEKHWWSCFHLLCTDLCARAPCVYLFYF